MSKAEDPFCGRRVEPFGQRREHHGDVMGRGFQAVQGGGASSGERGVAGRASKRLDPPSRAMLPIPDESVDLSIDDPGVRALRVGTSETFGVDPFGAPRRLFTSHQGRDFRRCRSHHSRVGAAEATGGAV